MLSPTLLIPLFSLPGLVLSQRYLVSFGSSYTETGYDIKGRQPSTAYPLGNPAYGQSSIPSKPNFPGTAGGGPNYIDHLVTTYNSTDILGFNFAVGGTVVDTTVVKGSSPDLRHQISDSFRDNHYPGIHDDTIYLIFMGDNDVQGSYRQSTPVDGLMKSYFEGVGDLYNYGSRNFLFVTVPQLDRAPSHNLTHDTAEQNKQLVNSIVTYNKGIRDHASDFKKAHADAHVEIYEFNNFMGTVLDAPKAHGFDDATCEGDGPDSKCVWWKPSDGHTTSRFQKMVAKDMGSVIEKFWGDK